jgi:hypothetical protein
MTRRSTRPPERHPFRGTSAGLLAVLAPAVLAAACGPAADKEPPSRSEQSAPVTQAQTASPAGSTRDAVGGARDIDWKAVDTAMGRPGALRPGDVHRYSFPRSDMRVTVGRGARAVRVKPSLALGSWVAFKATGDGAMAMGDLVLSEDEVAPVMSKLQEGGVEQTAVHHHVLHESPRVVYMHVHAQGDPVKIAQAVRAAVALTGTPQAPPGGSQAGGDKGDAGGAGGAAPARIDLDTAAVARTLGHAGKVDGGVYQVSVPRAEAIREHGVEVPPSMGLATAMNFQPTGGGRAAITGDFVMTAAEVNPVIRALRESGIEVTSLHNHLLGEEPRLFFMHFWAHDDAVKLARGLRAALDRTNSRRTGT